MGGGVLGSSFTPPQPNGTMVGQFEDQNSDFENPKFIQKAQDISEISGDIRFLKTSHDHMLTLADCTGYSTAGAKINGALVLSVDPESKIVNHLRMIK